jgi:hypothetical protein
MAELADGAKSGDLPAVFAAARQMVQERPVSTSEASAVIAGRIGPATESEATKDDVVAAE